MLRFAARVAGLAFGLALAAHAWSQHQHPLTKIRASPLRVRCASSVWRCVPPVRQLNCDTQGRGRGLFQRGYAYWRTAVSMRGRNELVAFAPWNATAAR